MRGRHVKRRIAGGGTVGRDLNRDDLPRRIAPLHMGHLGPGTLLDRNFPDPVAHRPVNRRAGQGHIERNVIRFCRQCLKVCADLVADIALRGGPVGADDDHIHLAMLHQVPAGVIDDQRMTDARRIQLPRGQLRALIAGPCFIDEHMHIDPGVDGVINRGRGRAPIHRRRPACIAMGQDVHATFSDSNVADHGQPVFANPAVHFNIVISNLIGARKGRLGPVFWRKRAQQPLHLIQRPAQIDRRGPGFMQDVPGLGQAGIGRVQRHLYRHTVSSGRPDQRRTPHPHILDRTRKFGPVPQRDNPQFMRQPALIDDHHLPCGITPDRPIGGAVDVHR